VTPVTQVWDPVRGPVRFGPVALDLAAVWTYFADTSCRDYSPLYDRICRAVAADAEVLALVGEAPPAGHQPNVLLAAVHDLLLGGLDHPLAAAYDGTSDADPGPLFVDVCLSHRDDVLRLLTTRRTNTNEVGRSALLGPALTEVARRFGAPLALVDVGCSAGLNLLCDRYLLDYGAAGRTGPPDAAVHITCDTFGTPVPIAPRLPTIAARVGVDRHPVDASDADEARWLLACVWPDTGRLPRTRRALEELTRTPPRLVQGDAVDTVRDVVLALPADALAVVTTTWALAYLSPERRVAFREALAGVSHERPVVWINGESPGVVDVFSGIDAPSDAHGLQANLLGMLTFGGGERHDELLAFVHPHGNWIEWHA
jgi:hypothetical protein